MAPPDPLEHFLPDDVSGNMGSGTGVFSTPKLDLLTTEMARVNVTVRVLDESLDDVTDEAMFLHNMESDDFDAIGATVRDINSDFDRWVVQVFAAYEGPLLMDHDPNTDDAALGATRAAKNDETVNIFLETIRDYENTVPAAVDVDTLKQRTVVHEILHTFGLGHSPNDVGIMVPETLGTGTAADNAVRGVQWRYVITARRPE